MKFNINKSCIRATALVALAAVITGCNDGKSYAELLTDETHAVNSFLANNKVELTLPSYDDILIGEDAPFYMLDEEGNIYMQVLDKGNRDMMAEDDDLVYFRFTRNSLYNYNSNTGEFSGEGWGNSQDLSVGSASFRYNNFTLSSSSQWGSGIQQPLATLGLGCRVNLIIKSQYGLNTEISQVVPYYYYDVRYFPPAQSGEFTPKEDDSVE